MLSVGLPPGAEFALAFIYIMIVYGIIRGFGPAAQAGFGIGARVMQALFLPVVALSFAVSPVVGQNFGGRRAERVRHTVYAALGLATAMMAVLAALTYLAPTLLIRGFSKDANVIAFGGEYMRIVAFNFVAAGVVFTASSVFQGIGNTVPPLLSSMTRLVVFALPAALLAQRPGFQIKYVWYLSRRLAGFAGRHQSSAVAARAAKKIGFRRNSAGRGRSRLGGLTDSLSTIDRR